MKVKFSKSVEYIPEWNGNRELPANEQIKTTLKPLRFDDLMLVMDAMGGQEAAKRAQEGATAEELGKSIKVTEVVNSTSDIIPKYVELTGLEADDGPVTAQDICRYPAFMSLAFELLSQLASISMPSETSAGNSEGQPDSVPQPSA